MAAFKDTQTKVARTLYISTKAVAPTISNRLALLTLQLMLRLLLRRRLLRLLLILRRLTRRILLCHLRTC